MGAGVGSSAPRWLATAGYEVWTPAGNRSSIVTFDHGKDIARVRSDLERAGVKVSLKQGGAQIRAGIALFNSDEDMDALLDVTGGWVQLERRLEELLG